MSVSDWTMDQFWAALEAHQGEVFYTAKKLPFTYTIKGREFFTERRQKSITRATFEKAFEKVRADTEKQITGPKKLNVFGAPYIWALFKHFDIV